MTLPDHATKSALLGGAGRGAQPVPFRQQMASELAAALGRAAGKLLHQSLTAELLHADLLDQPSLIDALSPGALSMTLLARGDQPIGLISLSAPFVAQLALQMSGANGTTALARRLSNVDQSLARMLVLRVLENLQTALTAFGAKAEIEGLCSGASDTARHVLQASLPPGNFGRFTFNFALDSLAQDHLVTFYFTYDFCASLSQIQPTTALKKTSSEAQQWQAHMRRVALLAPIESRCILDRFDLKTGEIARLKPGDIIPLPGLGLNDIVLELPHQSGALAFARGKLGAFRRSKALKLFSKISADDTCPPLELTDKHG